MVSMDSVVCMSSGTFNDENSVLSLLHIGLAVPESPRDLVVDITDLLVYNRLLIVPVRHSVRNVDDR